MAKASFEATWGVLFHVISLVWPAYLFRDIKRIVSDVAWSDWGTSGVSHARGYKLSGVCVCVPLWRRGSVRSCILITLILLKLSAKPTHPSCSSMFVKETAGMKSHDPDVRSANGTASPSVRVFGPLTW